jgi:cystathionine beta-synthase
MREHDISQLPVIEGGQVVGSLSEARILDILVSNATARTRPVVEYMEKPFPVVSDDASLTEVAQQMHREFSAVLVKHKDGFDIITKSDLIFFLTRKGGEKP